VTDPTDRQLLAAVITRAQLGREFLLALERELGAAGLWIDTGYYFDDDLDGAPILTGGVCGRQAVAVKGTSREGEEMWRLYLLNLQKDHEAALQVARDLLARQDPVKPGRPVLKLKGK
jgi:hypothetical protein